MTGVTADKILKREHSQLKTAGIKQKSIIKKLKISKFYQTQFETGRDFAITKLYRRHAQLLHLYLMHTTLLTEIAKRLKLTRYQVQFMLINEIKQALLTNKNYKKLLITRFKECVLYTEKDFETVYVGKIAKKITKTFKKFVNTDIKEITGQTAQPGFAKGLVKKIFRAKDMGKMNKGDILVSVATDPDIVPAMKKARAIVTEQGGITSHAAIVSRELGIPCVIGTKIATKVLKDGDLVEVDATKGIVKKLN
jgi:phosphoenolpyruvate synthase/pyruvate phosphate dikinase